MRLKIQSKWAYAGVALAVAFIAAALIGVTFMNNTPANDLSGSDVAAPQASLDEPVPTASPRDDFRPAASAQADATGRELYTIKGCYMCHGIEGQGALLTGSRLAPDPIPFEAFAVYVRRSPGEMPAYSRDVLSDDDLIRIYEYLQTRPHPPQEAWGGVKP